MINNFVKLVPVLLQPLAGGQKKEQRTSHSLLRAGGAAAPAGTLIETTHVYTTQPAGGLRAEGTHAQCHSALREFCGHGPAENLLI